MCAHSALGRLGGSQHAPPVCGPVVGSPGSPGLIPHGPHGTLHGPQHIPVAEATIWASVDLTWTLQAIPWHLSLCHLLCETWFERKRSPSLRRWGVISEVSHLCSASHKFVTLCHTPRLPRQTALFAGDFCSLSFQHCAPPSGILEGGTPKHGPSPTPPVLQDGLVSQGPPTPPSGGGA